MSARPWLDAPVLVAPDSFKGSFSATRVAALLGRGLELEGCRAVAVGIADGGEGTLDALALARAERVNDPPGKPAGTPRADGVRDPLGRSAGAPRADGVRDPLGWPAGVLRVERVSDPLGRPIDACYALLDGGRTAVLEVAQASGLGLVAEDERDAFVASTRGTGELIAAAAATGAEQIIIAAGGSATTDGGAGAVEATENLDPAIRLVVLCDVRTPWEDAPRLFAPQKGADQATVRRLERRLERLATSAPRDPRGVPMTGCAGGLSGGLWAHRGACLEPGAPYVLDAIGFNPLMRSARFVVTGEGRLDRQTLDGKAVGEVATRARQGGVACHAVVGENALDRFSQRVLDLASVTEARTEDDLVMAGRRLASDL